MKPPVEQAERCLALVQGGADPETAAESIGLTPDQFDLWKSDLEFLKRLDGAMTTARLLAQIELRKRAPGTWLAKNKEKSASKSASPKAEKPKQIKEKERKLSLRQEKFIREYLVDGNATQATIRAGYSKKGADVMGSLLLRNIRISEAIEKHRAKLLARTDITVERWLRELASLAFLNPKKFFGPDGGLLPIEEMPDEAATALAGIDVEELSEYIQGEGKSPRGTVKKIRFRDKAPILQMIGKYLGEFKPERHEIGGKNGQPIAVEVKETPMTDDERRLRAVEIAAMLRDVGALPNEP